jgi:hypothetical protein
MPRIRIPRPAFLLAAALVVACTTEPTGLCACDPAPFEAIVYGRVTLPDGAPAAFAVVQGQIGPAGCPPWADTWQANTGAAGSYRLSVYSYGSPPDRCQHVFAFPTAGSGLRGSDTLPFTVQFRGGSQRDSVRVDLVLRAP